MAVRDRARNLSPPLRLLVERFDPAALDPPAHEVRIRLHVAEDGEWDFLLRHHDAELGLGLDAAPAEPEARR